MRITAIALGILIVMSSVATADMSSASVQSYWQETWPGRTEAMTTSVWNGSTDESIAYVELYLVPAEYGDLGMREPSYVPDQFAPGRPSWDVYADYYGCVATWSDANGGSGEIWPGESGILYFTVDISSECLPGGYTFYYYICGDGSGAPPHDCYGSGGGVHVQDPSPAETESWGSIKALFR